MPHKWLVRYLKRKWRGDVSVERVAPTPTPAPAAPRPKTAMPPRVPSLSSATRDYARAVEGGILDRYSEEGRAPWKAAMGAEIWAWQRARLLTDQPPWRASTEVEDEYERRRAKARMLADIGTWEKALLALDARTRWARMFDRPVPPPLEVPQEVMALIEAKRAAALERASKARTRGEGGGAPPALKPDEDLSRPPFPKP